MCQKGMKLSHQTTGFLLLRAGCLLTHSSPRSRWNSFTICSPLLILPSPHGDLGSPRHLRLFHYLLPFFTHSTCSHSPSCQGTLLPSQTPRRSHMEITQLWTISLVEALYTQRWVTWEMRSNFLRKNMQRPMRTAWLQYTNQFTAAMSQTPFCWHQHY